MGLVLGLIWSPCVGPALGAATTLASQGRNLAQLTLLMALFGLRAGTPLVLLGGLSRASTARMRGGLSMVGKRGKPLLGAVTLLLGVAILSGLDKSFEAWVVEMSPQWLTELTTRY